MTTAQLSYALTNALTVPSVVRLSGLGFAYTGDSGRLQADRVYRPRSIAAFLGNAGGGSIQFPCHIAMCVSEVLQER
jgi:hypothetical protein